MKKVILSFLIIATTLATKSQNVGIGTNTPDPSAKLEVSSNNSGFLPPRMTFAQRNSIVSPAAGLIIYCTDCDISGQPQFFNGISWCNMLGGSASGIIITDLSRVTIGTQIWTTKNLDVATYRNGDPIPQVTDASEWQNLTTGAWCWYNNDSVNYAATYGRLYNWYAVNDPRILAPKGWHVPYESDWNKLVFYLDSNADSTCQACAHSIICGGKMKESGTSHWAIPNVGASNSSGLSFLPSGARGNNALFSRMNITGFYWSVDDFNQSNGYVKCLDYANSYLMSYISIDKNQGLSVRCLRDTIIIPSIPILSTITPTNTTNTTVASGGNITSDGGASITERGVCWSTNENPTKDLSTKTIDSTGIGIFTSNITNLTANTTYYIRAYATNSVGTSYGQELTFTTSNIDISTGLVAYYPFNGNAGDSSGNGNHGTVNGAALTTDRFGNSNKAYDFNGINNSIVVANSQTLNIIGNQISISYWMNFRNNIVDGKYQGVSKGGWDVGSGYELIFRYSYSGDPNNTGAVCLNSTNGGFNSEGINSFQNTWVNITSTFENGTQKTYYNGILQNTISAGAGISSFYSNTNNLYIGTRDPQNGYVGFLDGKMDDIRIYNRALTQAEITYLATH